MKKLDNFRDVKGYLVYKKHASAERYNAIDSNFLNSNTFYQQLLTKESHHVRYAANRFIKEFQHAPGILRRYYKNDRDVQINDQELNDECPYWMQPETVSRDNSMGFIVLAGYLGRYDVVRKFAVYTLKRGSFFQNVKTNKWEDKLVPDFCGLSQWATILRSCFGKKALIGLFPVLCVLDFFFMLALIWDVLYFRVNHHDYSTVFHTLSAVMQKKMTVQTPFSAIGCYVYLNYLPAPTDYNPKKADDHRIVACLKYYSNASYEPPIYDVSGAMLKRFKL